MKSNNQNAAVAAIQFALETDMGLTFLRLWNQGDFDKTRREWPEAPEAVYIGADPLHPETAREISEVEGEMLSAKALYVLADEHSNGWAAATGAYLFKPIALTNFAAAIQSARR